MRTSNNALERTGNHRGRIGRAQAMVRAQCKAAVVAAAQLGRYT